MYGSGKWLIFIGFIVICFVLLAGCSPSSEPSSQSAEATLSEPPSNVFVSAQGANTVVNQAGCQIGNPGDSDCDGEKNEEDNCPYTNGPAENRGCPWTITEESPVCMTNFQGTVNIRIRAQPSINAAHIGDVASPDQNIQIIGHAYDESGDWWYEVRISDSQTGFIHSGVMTDNGQCGAIGLPSQRSGAPAQAAETSIVMLDCPDIADTTALLNDMPDYRRLMIQRSSDPCEQLRQFERGITYRDRSQLDLTPYPNIEALDDCETIDFNRVLDQLKYLADEGGQPALDALNQALASGSPCAIIDNLLNTDSGKGFDLPLPEGTSDEVEGDLLLVYCVNPGITDGRFEDLRDDLVGWAGITLDDILNSDAPCDVISNLNIISAPPNAAASWQDEIVTEFVENCGLGVDAAFDTLSDVIELGIDTQPFYDELSAFCSQPRTIEEVTAKIEELREGCEQSGICALNPLPSWLQQCTTNNLVDDYLQVFVDNHLPVLGEGMFINALHGVCGAVFDYMLFGELPAQRQITPTPTWTPIPIMIPGATATFTPSPTATGVVTDVAAPPDSHDLHEEVWSQEPYRSNTGLFVARNSEALEVYVVQNNTRYSVLIGSAEQNVGYAMLYLAPANANGERDQMMGYTVATANGSSVERTNISDLNNPNHRGSLLLPEGMLLDVGSRIVIRGNFLYVTMFVDQNSDGVRTTENRTIWEVDVSGNSNPRQLLFEAATGSITDAYNPAVSPDGTMILFESGDGENHHIYLSIEGENVPPPLDAGINGTCTSPVFDLDGNIFYFICNGVIYRDRLGYSQERMNIGSAENPILCIAQGLDEHSFVYGDGSALYDYAYELEGTDYSVTRRTETLVSRGTHEVFDLFWLR